MVAVNNLNIQEAFARLKVKPRTAENLTCGSVSEVKAMMKAVFLQCDECITADSFVWYKEYDIVAKWLSNTKGKGLLLTGSCGLGKTLLLKYVIPTILLLTNSKVLTPYHAKDTLDKAKAKEMLSKRFICIDDIGSETFLSDYGQRINVVHDIILSAEEDNKMLVVSTNLNSEQITTKYDIRAYDRLNKICIPVNFGDKKSLR